MGCESWVTFCCGVLFGASCIIENAFDLWMCVCEKLLSASREERTSKTWPYPPYSVIGEEDKILFLTIWSNKIVVEVKHFFLTVFIFFSICNWFILLICLTSRKCGNVKENHDGFWQQGCGLSPRCGDPLVGKTMALPLIACVGTLHICHWLRGFSTVMVWC